MQNLDIHGVHFNLDDSLKKYITKKVNKLDKYLTPGIEVSAHVDVYLKENKTKNGKQCECEVVYQLPKETIRIKDATINMYAAVDIVEEKLKLSLKKYKDTHYSSHKQRHLLARLKFQF